MVPSLLSPLLLIGCRVGPEYAASDLSPRLGERWSSTSTSSAEANEPTWGEPPTEARHAQDRWWRAFEDPELTCLVEQALETNLDVAQAVERIALARARRGVDAAARLPSLDATGDYRYAESGRDSTSLNGTPPGTNTDVLSLGVAAGWELDLFGRVARLVEAADAEVSLAVEDVAAVRVALAAEVAREVIRLRTVDERRRVVGRMIASDETSLAMTRSRARAGVATDFDRLRSERSLAAHRAELPVLEADRRATECRLATLLGTPAGSVTVGDVPLPRTPPMPPLGIPADLLVRRPDIRRAERALAAATARIGAAVADRYPRVSLSGTFAFSASEAGGLFDGDARTLGIGPSITMPLFTGGRVESAIDARRAEARVAHHALESTVTRAVAEVETAIARRRRSFEAIEELERAQAHAAEAEALAQSLYRSGGSDFLNVLEAQSERYAIEERLALARESLLEASINLVTSLGGGFDPTSVHAAASPPR